MTETLPAIVIRWDEGSEDADPGYRAFTVEGDEFVQGAWGAPEAGVKTMSDHGYTDITVERAPMPPTAAQRHLAEVGAQLTADVEAARVAAIRRAGGTTKQDVSNAIDQIAATHGQYLLRYKPAKSAPKGDFDLAFARATAETCVPALALRRATAAAAADTETDDNVTGLLDLAAKLAAKIRAAVPDPDDSVVAQARQALWMLQQVGDDVAVMETAAELAAYYVALRMTGSDPEQAVAKLLPRAVQAMAPPISSNLRVTVSGLAEYGKTKGAREFLTAVRGSMSEDQRTLLGYLY